MHPFFHQLTTQVEHHKSAGTLKQLKHLTAPMDAHSAMKEAHGEVIVLSSNNYLGLANHPEVVEESLQALKTYGAGTASVRFICGTMTIHEELETALAAFHKTEAALTYSSCWAANTGLLPVICKPGDVLISDALNHASIIDGCRATHKQVIRKVYRHSDMAHLEELLQTHQPETPENSVFIITDGVFSMEGDIAKLPELVALKKKYNAVLIVDDSHGTGVMGQTGKGVAEHFAVEKEVDIYTSTLGKALGGAAGGYVAGPKCLIEMLIQASRPHIFSNAISPATAGAALGALKVLNAHPERVTTLHKNVAYFRNGLKQRGFKPLEGESAIVPIIVGETATAIKMSEALLKEGFFVTGFGFPVVPEGTARIRVQLCASHTQTDLNAALTAFEKIGRRMGILSKAA